MENSKNRLQAAKQWIRSLSAEQQYQALKEAKAKYKNQLKAQVMELMQKQMPKAQKHLAVNRLFLITKYLEEHQSEMPKAEGM